VDLVRQLARHLRELPALAPRARAIRRGVKRSIISARAYGFATSKTLKSG
jgi:hypothetical protein